jgi:hypothetical protein
MPSRRRRASPCRGRRSGQRSRAHARVVPATKSVVDGGERKGTVRVASAYLSKTEFQDLAEIIGDVGNAVVGYDLKIKVQIEVGGDGKSPPDEVIAKVNAKMGKVSKNLRLD